MRSHLFCLSLVPIASISLMFGLSCFLLYPKSYTYCTVLLYRYSRHSSNSAQTYFVRSLDKSDTLLTTPNLGKQQQQAGNSEMRNAAAAATAIHNYIQNLILALQESGYGYIRNYNRIHFWKSCRSIATLHYLRTLRPTSCLCTRICNGKKTDYEEAMTVSGGRRRVELKEASQPASLNPP